MDSYFKRVVFGLLCLLLHLVSFSQEIKGFVRGIELSGGIPFATLYAIDQGVGCVCDSLGYFEFKTVLPDRVKLRVSAAQFETKLVEVKSSDFIDGLITISLQEHHLDLDEVVVSNNQMESQKHNSFHIETRKLEDLNTFPSNSAAEMLSNIPGVYNSSTGIGISKPVIRGSQGIRIVTLVNGLRIENQQWGGDHGMGITELGIGSVEVIKGPSSLLYGADALGGVVYFVDEPYVPLGQSQVNIRSGFESATLGLRSSATYKFAAKKFRINVGGLYSDHADYRLPDGKFAQNSRFQDQAFKASVGTNRKNWAMHIRYTFSHTRAGIPGHSHDSLPVPSEFQVAQQNRNAIIPAQVFHNHYLSIENKFFFKRHEFFFLGGQTFNRLTEYEEKVTIPGILTDLHNSLYQFRHKVYVNEWLTLVSGYQGMVQLNNNSQIAEERLLPDALTLDNGMYSIAYLAFNKWDLQAGVRYDVRKVESLEEFKGSQPLTRWYQGLNYSAGAVWNEKNQTIRANISSGYRAPHLSELLAKGYHHGALRYEIGDQELRSERATQLDLTYEFDGEHFQLMINPFGSLLEDYIFLDPMDSIIEGLPAFRYRQLSRGYSYGADIGLHYHPHFAHRLHAELSYSYVDIRGEELNVSMIPPGRITGLIKYDIGMVSNFSIERVVAQYTYFLAQDRVAAFETPTGAYGLLNVGLEMKWAFRKNHEVTLKTGVRNALNTSYIDHLSRLKNIQLPFPGRNIYLSISYQINYKSKSRSL